MAVGRSYVKVDTGQEGEGGQRAGREILKVTGDSGERKCHI